MTIATVESCTGGGIAYALTEVAGSSAWFEQSWVTYSNRSKIDCVGVSKITLEQHGAVSEEVVAQMAEGGRKYANTDLALSVSGIAGPSGGSTDKPVGLVWFGLANDSSVNTFRHVFKGNRYTIRQQAICQALEIVTTSLND